MNAGVAIRDMLARCPFQSLVGAIDASLALHPPAAILAVPMPGEIDHDPDEIDAVRVLLQSGATVLVMAAAHRDRERLLDMLGIADADRIRQGGRA